MSTLKNIFKKYLDESKISDLGSMGGQQQAPSNTNTLKERLIKQSKFNNSILIISIVLLCILFFLGVYFAIYYRDEPTTMSVVLGGSIFSLLGIIVWLRKLWAEKNLMDVSLAIIEDLPPQEAAKYILIIYDKMFRKKSTEDNS